MLWTQIVPSLLHHHHQTPELIRNDTKVLASVPRHVAVVLEYTTEGGLDQLMDQVGEISCWCVSAEIGRLSVYERKGTRPDGLCAMY